MVKNRKAWFMYRVWSKIVIFIMWKNRKLMSFEHKKMDRIYRRHGFAPAFDYLHECNMRLYRRSGQLRRASRKRDRYFCDQFEG